MPSELNDPSDELKNRFEALKSSENDQILIEGKDNAQKLRNHFQGLMKSASLAPAIKQGSYIDQPVLEERILAENSFDFSNWPNGKLIYEILEVIRRGELPFNQLAESLATIIRFHDNNLPIYQRRVQQNYYIQENSRKIKFLIAWKHEAQERLGRLKKAREEGAYKFELEERRYMENWYFSKKVQTLFKEAQNFPLAIQRQRAFESIIDMIKFEFRGYQKCADLYMILQANDFQTFNCSISDKVMYFQDKDTLRLEDQNSQQIKFYIEASQSRIRRDILSHWHMQAESQARLAAKEEARAYHERGFEYDQPIDSLAVNHLQPGHILYLKTESGSVYQFEVAKIDEQGVFVQYVSGPETLKDTAGYISMDTIKKEHAFKFSGGKTSDLSEFQVRTSPLDGQAEWQKIKSKYNKPEVKPDPIIEPKLEPVPEPEKIDILHKLVLQVGDEVYVLRSSCVVEKGWYVKKINDDGTYTLSNPAIGRKIEIGVLDNNVWTLSQIEDEDYLGDAPKVIQAEFMRREQQMLRSFAILPEEDFHSMFDGWISQQNVGNCYLIAALNSLRISPRFEAVVRTSVEKISEDLWKVQVPLGKSNGTWIEVNVLDLNPQQSPNYGKTKNNRIDERTHLNPVDGPIGYKIIEAAYIKSVCNGKIDRLAIEGGFTYEALELLLGVNTSYGKVLLDHWDDIDKQYYKKLSEAELKKESRAHLQQLLDNFHPGRYLATLSTPSSPKSDGHDSSFRISGVDYDFAYGHAYSLVNVDKNRQLAGVVNPWNTNQVIQMSYDQVMQAFRRIYMNDIKIEQLFASRFLR